MKFIAAVLSVLAIWFTDAAVLQAQTTNDSAISYKLNHARTEQVVPIIKQLLGENLHVAADSRINALIVVGRPADHQMVATLVERLDLPPVEAANTVLVELPESLQHKELDPTLEQLAKSLNLNILQAKRQQTHLLVQGPVVSRNQFQELLSKFGQRVAELERSESRMLRVAILESQGSENGPIHGDDAAQALLDKVKKLGLGSFELVGQCLLRCKIGPQKNRFETEGSLPNGQPFKLTGNARLGDHNDAFRIEMALAFYRIQHLENDNDRRHRDHVRDLDHDRLRASVNGDATMQLNSWTLMGSALIDGRSVLVMAQMLPANLN